MQHQRQRHQRQRQYVQISNRNDRTIANISGRTNIPALTMCLPTIDGAMEETSNSNRFGSSVYASAMNSISLSPAAAVAASVSAPSPSAGAAE